MTERQVLALLCGYCLGQLPEDTTLWAAVHLLIATAIAGLLVRAARKSDKRQSA